MTSTGAAGGWVLEPDEVLTFWLEDVGRRRWYRADPALDAEMKRRFGASIDAAVAGMFDTWAETREGALALILLLDQFTRNCWRDAPHAFAGDPRARQVADAAIARGFDLETPEPERQFFYTPFMHSEELADQDRSVALIRNRITADPSTLRHAEAHRALIVQFGRFPHRNHALSRDSTAAEAAHLESGGYQPSAAPIKDRAVEPGADEAASDS